MKCSECGKITKHYLSSKGEYRCLVCGTVNKVATPKQDLEITFEADEELDKDLNPDLEETQIDESTVEDVNETPGDADIAETPVNDTQESII